MTDEQMPEKATELENSSNAGNASTTEITSDEKNWAVLAHLIPFVGILIPFGQILAPLIIYMFKKEDSKYITAHAVESVNFQITFTIALFISSLSLVILIGFVILPVVFIAGVIVMIIAAIKASKGEHYQYPMTIRLFS